MDENDHTYETTHAPPPLETGVLNNKSARIEFSLEKYRPYLEDAELSETQKLELLQALWLIITSFVDLGFQIHPVQQACGQHQFTEAVLPIERGDALCSQMKSCIEDFRSSGAEVVPLVSEGGTP
ncbi:MAG: hypothetical protein QNI84_14085 [Henriciella sp.]|nr:hypothetical protein [Henriciella sp.]